VNYNSLGKRAVSKLTACHREGEDVPEGKDKIYILFNNIYLGSREQFFGKVSQMNAIAYTGGILEDRIKEKTERHFAPTRL